MDNGEKELDEYGDDWERCEDCAGLGWVWEFDPDWPNHRWRDDCSECFGTGVIVT
jgi:DnaJ-class molecular chaperone